MGDKTRGLYPDGKFVVQRKDGTDAPGGKHDGCEYFVLDLSHDQHAIPAVRAYATSARRDGYELLANDLEALVGVAPDAEQLSELRKACKAALPYVREVLAYTRSKPRIRCATRTIEQLQKAIGGTNEKAVNRRDVSMERESGIQRVDADGEPDADNRHSASNDTRGSKEDSGIPQGKP